MELMDRLLKTASENVELAKEEAEKGDIVNGHETDETNGPVETGKDSKEKRSNGFSHASAGENKTAYSLMDSLEKVAYGDDERYPELARNVDEAHDAYAQYPNATGARLATFGGAVAAGGAGGAMAGKRLGGGVGATLGGLAGAGVGAGAGIIGQIPINNHLNSANPGRQEAFDAYGDAIDAYEQAEDYDKQASPLMNDLEKTAANAFGKVKELGGHLSGKTHSQAKATSQNTFAALKGSTNAADTAKAEQASRFADSAEAAAKKAKNKSRAAVGVAAGAGVGAGAAANRDKEASQLMTDLEKTAANALGALKNTMSAASGKGYNTANKAHKELAQGTAKATSPEAIQRNAEQIGVLKGGYGKARKNATALEGNLASSADGVAAAKAARNQARGALAPAAIGAAGATGAAAGAAGANAKKDKENEKTASEALMNELYKEAATQILDMATPETKVYSDPMDRISFPR